MENSGALQFFDIIRVDNVKGNLGEEFKNFPMYELLNDGTIKESYGRKRDPEDILFYDVSNASLEFKEKYSSVLEELEVKGIKRIIRPKRSFNNGIGNGRIVTLLPLSGNVYGTLSKQELKCLGNEFYTLSSTPDGFKLSAIIKGKILPDNLFIAINTSAISEELFEKLSPDLTELSELPNGLYESKGSISTEKKMN